MMPMAADRLQPGLLLPQRQVGAILAELESAAGNLDAPLAELLRWSESIGYFAHLQRENDRLAWHDPALGTDLRLQINYSRLGYNPAQQIHARGCPLCHENLESAGKPLLRAHEFILAGTPYFAHPTPFPLCPGHFVVNRRQHTPMEVSAVAIAEGINFVRRAPGWLLASNSDVEWAGASVLGHHHFQVFRQLELPIERARIAEALDSNGVRVALLEWLAPACRIVGDRSGVHTVGCSLVSQWKSTDPGRCTFNYLLREDAGIYTLTLIFRHPDFRTAEDLRHIKAEGVGVIEMAGETIVPPIAAMSQEENHAWFSAHGLAVARGIIGGNAPAAPRFPSSIFRTLLFGRR